ncbi:TadE family type IV pilus minor pilin [Cellulomonas sp.]|uniref:TadE family type IV pilus minor pilin n=1 Tax=Cellulomonas sp. TaxID=40001 RepID=UPI0028116B94|nr:TadE family type IV pilus minor pilin [Cellulomonas sp.]
MTGGRRGGPEGRARPSGDRGAVTAELAIGMVAVAVVLVAVLATGAAALAQLRCLDAARTAARVAATGEQDGAALAAARDALGGRAADVHVARSGGWVTVRVSAPVVGWAGLGGLRAEASATSWAEPGTAGAVGVPSAGARAARATDRGRT